LADGTPITLVSAPTWGNFSDQLSQVADGGYVVSPELITTATKPEYLTEPNKAIYLPRINSVCEWSKNHRSSTVLLGSPHEEQTIAFNSLLVVKNGKVTGAVHKAELASGDEEYYVSDESTRTGLAQNPLHQIAVCADIANIANRLSGRIGTSRANAVLLQPTTESLIVASCISAPIKSLSQKEFDKIFGNLMRQFAATIFKHTEVLKDIVLCDRIPRGTEIHRPFNAHFRREEVLQAIKQ